MSTTFYLVKNKISHETLANGQVYRFEYCQATLVDTVTIPVWNDKGRKTLMNHVAFRADARGDTTTPRYTIKAIPATRRKPRGWDKIKSAYQRDCT